MRHLRKATRDRRSARHFFKYGLLVASMSAAAPSCGIYGISLVRRHKHNRIISGAGRARDSDGVFAVLHSTAPFLRGFLRLTCAAERGAQTRIADFPSTCQLPPRCVCTLLTPRATGRGYLSNASGRRGPSRRDSPNSLVGWQQPYGRQSFRCD